MLLSYVICNDIINNIKNSRLIYTYTYKLKSRFRKDTYFSRTYFSSNHIRNHTMFLARMRL